MKITEAARTFEGHFIQWLRLCINIDRQKIGWATFWANFFTNSSGHPGRQLQVDLAFQLRCSIICLPVLAFCGRMSRKRRSSQFGKHTFILTSVVESIWKAYIHTYFGGNHCQSSVREKSLSGSPAKGCQMVCFQTKNPNLDKFWRVLLWKMLVYFMTIWSILRPLEILYGHLVYFVVIWYIFPVLVFWTKKNLATLVVRYQGDQIWRSFAQWGIVYFRQFHKITEVN
jgi:hypothetical protein